MRGKQFGGLERRANHPPAVALFRRRSATGRPGAGLRQDRNGATRWCRSPVAQLTLGIHTPRHQSTCGGTTDGVMTTRDDHIILVSVHHRDWRPCPIVGLSPATFTDKI